MPRFKLTISYDGTDFIGWQKQPSGRSVQGTIENALKNLFGIETTVVGSGRTDAGVHAIGQSAHVDVDVALPPDTFCTALNSHLPRDIRILNVCPVPPTFHARYDALERTYFYLFHPQSDFSPFARYYVWHLSSPLNIEKMQEAASLLIGQHDFSAFRATGGGHTSPCRKISLSHIFPCTGSIYAYLITADAFLRKMVRSIMGTLVEIGMGKFEPSRMTQLLETGNRSLIGATAPPHGLYLAVVTYPSTPSKAHYDEE